MNRFANAQIVLVAGLALALLMAPNSLQAQSSAPRGQAWYDFGGDGSYLGVYLEDLSSAVRAALGLEEDTGVLLQRVTEDGPAGRAGLQPGDVLLQLGGNKVHSASRLSRVLDRFDPDDQVTAVVWRKGEEKKFQVTLGKRKSYAVSLGSGTLAEVPNVEIALPTLSFSTLFAGGSQGMGLRTEELTGQLAEYFQVQRGVLVIWVTREGRARKAGLKAGDVIVGVEDQPIQGKADLEETLSDYSRSKELALQVMRRGEKKTLTVAR
jgi:serine protease Do